MNVVVSIGNTDNKLTQKEWSDFVAEVNEEIERREVQVHFFGGSPNWTPWQNVAWILEINDVALAQRFLGEVQRIRAKYRQDSAWVLVGKGEMV
jgi:hypothetical protein